MNAKTFLLRGYRIDEQINSMLNEITDLREKATSIGSFDTANEHVSKSASGDASYTAIINKIADIESKINDKINVLLDVKSSINSAIDSVDDADERLILRYRYINYYDWQTISTLMHYSERHVYRIHGNALLNVKRVIECQ